jgi:hypothetical protein
VRFQLPMLARIATPTNALLLSLCIVCAVLIASNWYTPSTALSAALMLLPWRILEAAVSATFADQHGILVAIMTIILGLLAYSVLSLPIYLAFRKKLPMVSALLQYLWLVGFLLLFFIFLPVMWE